ncbi:MAG TPA: hypothetical protein VFH48_18020 [Chloroflexota bacterium]|nr:hypothetical protein [Chloroflexota bacterium]
MSLMSRWERPSSDRQVAMIRTSLGEDAYEVAFADGRAMPMEQAIELVLELAAEIQAASPCPPAPPVVPPDRGKVERLRAAVRVTIGDEVFASTWAEGRAMTLQQAVAYALEEQPSA